MTRAKSDRTTIQIDGDLDIQILAAAKAMFREHGIAATEMQNIAKEVGCSRSTLYRHFSSKNELLTALAIGSMNNIWGKLRLPADTYFDNGYEEFVCLLRQYQSNLIRYVDDLVFLQELDRIYTKDFVSDTYRDYITNAISSNSMGRAFTKGVEDGSIKITRKEGAIDSNLQYQVINHTCVALAQRIMPRERIYQQEYGYGKEIVQYFFEMLVEILRG